MFTNRHLKHQFGIFMGAYSQQIQIENLIDINRIEKNNRNITHYNTTLFNSTTDCSLQNDHKVKSTPVFS